MFLKRSQILWFSLLLGGCGYTLNHRLKECFLDSRPIFIPVFDNRTDETGAELIFTNALLRELKSRSVPRISEQRKGSLLMEGTVESISFPPSGVTDIGTLGGLASYRRIPSEFGVSVVIHLVLSDPEKDQVLWDRRFTAFRRVNAIIDRTTDGQAPSSLGFLNQSLIESTYPDIARQMMRDVQDEMLELF